MKIHTELLGLLVIISHAMATPTWVFASQNRALQWEANLWATSHGRIMSQLTVACPRTCSYIRPVMLPRGGSFLIKNKELKPQRRGRQHNDLIRHRFLSFLSLHLSFCLPKLEKQGKEVVWQAHNLGYKLLHLFLVCSHLTLGKNLFTVGKI